MQRDGEVRWRITEMERLWRPQCVWEVREGWDGGIRHLVNRWMERWSSMAECSEQCGSRCVVDYDVANLSDLSQNHYDF